MSAAIRKGGAALAIAACLLAGCGGGDAPAAAPASPDQPRRYDTPAAAPALAAAPASTAAGPAIGSGQLEYPDDEQMILLAQHLAEGDPAATIRQWAEASEVVRRANEFEREAALAGEIQRLEAIRASVVDVGRLRIQTSTRLGDYDLAAGVWYLSAFQPGQVFSFSRARSEAKLAIGNAREAYRWPMPAAEAEALKRRTEYRNFEVDIDLQITGGRMRGSGPQIDARVTEFRLRTTGGNAAEIGHVTLP